MRLDITGSQSGDCLRPLAVSYGPSVGGASKYWGYWGAVIYTTFLMSSGFQILSDYSSHFSTPFFNIASQVHLKNAPFSWKCPLVLTEHTSCNLGQVLSRRKTNHRPVFIVSLFVFLWSFPSVTVKELFLMSQPYRAEDISRFIDFYKSLRISSLWRENIFPLL